MYKLQKWGLHAISEQTKLLFKEEDKIYKDMLHNIASTMIVMDKSKVLSSSRSNDVTIWQHHKSNSTNNVSCVTLICLVTLEVTTCTYYNYVHQYNKRPNK